MTPEEIEDYLLRLKPGLREGVSDNINHSIIEFTLRHVDHKYGPFEASRLIVRTGLDKKGWGDYVLPDLTPEQAVKALKKLKRPRKGGKRVQGHS
jgi:hypothetical protein